MEVTTRGAASLSISLLNLEAILLVVVCCHTSLELRIVFVLEKVQSDPIWGLDYRTLWINYRMKKETSRNGSST